MGESSFSLIEVEAIHHAFVDAMAVANERDATMPSSAAAFRAQAALILAVRNKILATLPPKHRRNYP
ncbi:MAG TPA: hypothetical protein VJ865_08135, partial [Gemmatimonadaceae bacterium]|nr:hypothetical protein [Gemmatimonadaceae bacterium]